MKGPPMSLHKPRLEFENFKTEELGFGWQDLGFFAILFVLGGVLSFLR